MICSLLFLMFPPQRFDWSPEISLSSKRFHHRDFSVLLSYYSCPLCNIPHVMSGIVVLYPQVNSTSFLESYPMTGCMYAGPLRVEPGSVVSTSL